MTFTAQVAPLAASGSGRFVVDGTPVGVPATLDAAGRATCTTTTLGIGAHGVTFVYAGNAN